jgi:hypothetical protein
MTIWNPTPDIFELFQEGYHLKIYFLTPARSPLSTLRFENMSTFSHLPHSENRQNEYTENAIHLMADSRTRYTLVSRIPPPTFINRYNHLILKNYFTFSILQYLSIFSSRMTHSLHELHCLRSGKEFDIVGLIIAVDERHTETVVENVGDDV